jgi:hypothetical protein
MPSLIDRTGKQYGSLLVLGRGQNQGSKVRWECLCTLCGNTVAVTASNLEHRPSKSCGCARKGPRADIHTSQLYGHLFVWDWSKDNAAWLVSCKICHKFLLVKSHDLTSGRRRTCGNHRAIDKLQRDYPYEYKSFTDMLRRCTDPKHADYPSWGGRGVTVCEEWLQDRGFEFFFLRLGPHPPGTTLHRIKNELGYSPDNTKWSTVAEQNRNRRISRLLPFMGQTMNLVDFANEIRMSQQKVSRLLDGDWTPEQIADEAGYVPVTI